MNPLNTEYKVIFLYFKKGFTVQEIAMVLNLKSKQIDTIVDQELNSISQIQKQLFISHEYNET